MSFEVKDLTYALPGRTLFENVAFTLTIRRNDSPMILALRGPSGSGKTTLLRCLAELIPYKSGIVTVDGKTSNQYGIPEWRSKVMYVPQRPPAVVGTPRQFVETMAQFGAQKRRRVQGQSPEDIGYSWNLPHDVWDKEWAHLSGGEIQRVALAIAVSRDPDVLLLDEPTSALDPDTAILVERSLSNFTCVWITHSPEQEARVATHTLTLGRGDGQAKVDCVGR
ncbi:hypothetical protein HK104_009610 [Borealophlyctis nickersoniae]|nr:hypothetical protein HK104_009610 [Borealophlyctis nickersoniae]